MNRQPWQVIGSPFDDTLTTSGTGGDVVFGLGGDDSVTGGSGPDSLHGDVERVHDTRSDTLTGGGGRDSVWSYGGNDVLRGGPGSDVLHRYSRPASQLYGATGNDYVETVVSGGTRSGVRRAGATSATIRAVERWRRDPGLEPQGCVGHVRRNLAGALSIRPSILFASDLGRLFLEGGHWTTFGTEGADMVDARGALSLSAFGRDGDDVLRGSGGADRFDGGAGSDTVLPRGGYDVCVAIEVGAPRCEVS